MKTRIIALFAGLLAVLPMTSAWANTDTYYYAKATATVSSTGGGKVYASSTSVTSPDSKCTETTSASGVGKSAANKQSVTLYRYAKADEGFEFKGWSTEDNADISTITDTSTSVTVSPSATSESGANNYTYYAYFEKLKLAAFGITFEASDAGTYTVDGKAPANKTGLTEATTVKLASSDPNFLNWKVNDAVINDNPYALTCIATTTVSAEFLTADQVTEATTYDELTAALANDGKKKITIPAGVDIVIAKGDKVSVPRGKQLIVNGKLAVVGTLEAQGVVAGAGKVLKIVKSITQSDPITPQNSHTSYPGKKYCKTTVSSVSSAVSGTVSCASGWGVMLNGTRLFEISAQDPYALNVSFSSDVINQITSISGVQTSDNTTASSGSFLLLKSWKINNATYSGIVDCGGGNTLNYPSADDYHKNFTVVNGKVTHSSGNFKNGTITCINCTSCEIHCCWNTPNFNFYDCGTAAEPATIKFTYRNSSGNNDVSSACTKAYQKAYFYSGYFNYSFSANNDKDVGNSYVYGGSFSSDPTDKSIIEPGFEIDSSSGRYVLVKSAPKPNVVNVGAQAYKTLKDAIDAAASGARLNLIQAIELDGQLTIDPDKQLTIDLCGFNLSGGSIVNEGKLRFEDTNSSDTKGTMSVPVTNKGNGTIDITYGNYSGTITLNGGALTTHNGTFASTFSVVENGGVWQLKGGKYACQVTVPEGYTKYDNGYVGEIVKGLIRPDNPLSASADFSYTVKGLEDDEYSLPLYSKYMHGTTARNEYSDTEWDRVAELRSSAGQVGSKYIEAAIVFDRAVKQGTFCGVVKAPSPLGVQSLQISKDLEAGEEYRLLIPLILGYSYTPKSYNMMFNGAEEDVWATFLCGGKNVDKDGNISLDNIGTTCTLKFQLRTKYSDDDYRLFDDIASQSYKFTGKGAIAGSTDYTSLATAVEKVAEGGTVRLSKDCAEAVSVARACSFALDANGFAFSGSIKPAEGYEMKISGGQFVFSRKKAEEQTENQDETTEPVAIIDTPKVMAAAGIEGTVAVAVDEHVVKALTDGGKTESEVKAMVEDAVKAVPEEKKTVVFAVVEDDGKAKPVTESAVGLADLKTGAYTQIKRSTVEIGGKVTEAVETTGERKSVVRNESREQTVVLAIPGETTVADAVKTTPTPGDQIQVYDAAEGAYRSWTFKDGDWEPVGETQPSGNDKVIVNTTEAKNEKLLAGSVIRYRKADPSKTVAVAVVADYTEDVSSTPLEQGKTDGTDPKWNLMANPTGNDFDLGKVDDGVNDKDKIVVVPAVGIGQVELTRKNGKWGRYMTAQDPKTGRVRKTWYGEGDKDHPLPKIQGGQVMWYISNGGQPTIRWNEE